MAASVAIFRDGKIDQFAEPDALLARPANSFVADFVGKINFVDATVVRCCGDGVEVDSLGLRFAGAAADTAAAGDRVTLAIRPERLCLTPVDEVAPADALSIEGAIEHIAFLGNVMHTEVRGAEGTRLLVESQPADWTVGARLRVRFRPADASVLTEAA